MRINQRLFPVILLATFFLVIVLGVIGGYWQTHSGGQRGHSLAATPPAAVVLVSGAEGE